MNLLWNRYTRSIMLRLVQCLPIRRGRVMCVCWGGEQYTCNPKAIALELIKHKEFDVWFAFLQPDKFVSSLPQGIHVVEIGSLDYFKLLASSRFVIANTRFAGGLFWPMPKKNNQYYIQTMHGPHGVKKVEFAASDTLPIAYIQAANKDNYCIDLMLSNSDYSTERCRSAFRYDGEILEQGLPRNDVFFDSKFAKTTESSYRKYLIYTPTFRNNGRRDVYGFDVDKVVSALESRFGGEWYIRISSHPNMRGYYREVYDFSHPRLIDVGNEDLQPLLLTSDALITDYSSAEMDFSLTGRPIFQLCKDRQDYDRGFYLNPETLPFPYAETEEQLVLNILSFDADKYAKDLEAFNRDVIGLHEIGHASEAVVEWMIKKMNA